MSTNVKTKVQWSILHKTENGSITTTEKDTTLRGLRGVINKMDGRFISAIPLHITDYERLGRYYNIKFLTEHDMRIIAREQSKYIEAKYALGKK